MTERRDELRRAAEAAQQFDMSRVQDAFSDITPSPLGRLIEEMLPSVPDGELRTLLQRISDLKSGTLDDLFDPQFQSFLISYLRADLSALLRIAQALRTQQLAGCEEDDALQIAARGGDAAGISAHELRSLLSRRRFP